MKVYPLQTGSTKVPFGQFYGGLEGWAGLGGVWRFATDKSHYIRVPIHAYLIEHPSRGPLLFDTGISRAQAHEHDRYYGGIMGLALDDDEYSLEPGEELLAQLDRLGYEASDIGTIILSHLHEDHVGELAAFPHASVLLPAEEWRHRRQRLFGLIPIYYEPSYEVVRRWRFAELASGSYRGFSASENLFGDESLVLVPTPGHTLGHASLIVRMEGYRILLAADALYTLRHLAVDTVQPITFSPKGRALYEGSIRRIQRLKREMPDLVIVPTHDHTDYQFDLVRPALEKGQLSERDRERILAYEEEVFDADFRLRGALPVFVPPPKGRKVGSVGTAR